MYEIVVGIDQDETRARTQAAELLELPLDYDSVHVTLVHDFEENREGASVTQVAAVRRAKELLEEADVDVSLEGTSGKPAAGILEVADAKDADLVVLAGRKRSPAGKALFGSVTQDVILGTDRSVLVVSSDQD